MLRCLQRDPYCRERTATPDNSCCGQGHGTHLGIRDGRHFTLSIDPTSHQLLQTLRRWKAIRRKSGAHTNSTWLRNMLP